MDTVKLKAVVDTPVAKHWLTRGVTAKLAAMGIWKLAVMALVLVVGVSGIGAAAAVVVGRIMRNGPPQPGITLTKIVNLSQFHTKQAQYIFDFTKQIHGTNPLTGETIHAVGRGTDDAYVDFKYLTEHAVLVSGGSVVLVLPHARLAPPYIEMNKTKLTESDGLLTRVSHVLDSGAGDGLIAIEAAEASITAQATSENLTGQAEAGAESFLTQFLKELGYSKVTVIFA